MGLNKNQQVFLEVVKAGLWDRNNLDYNLLETQREQATKGRADFNGVNWEKIYNLASEQSVVGLLAAGIDNLELNVPLELKLQIIGEALQIEQQNKAMNQFIADIVDKMCLEGIYTLLVKGQGIAQCYERPQWRASGDVDFLLDKENYRKAIDFLRPLSSYSKREENYSSHLGLSIAPWYVEVHGSLRTGLSARVDKVVDEVHEDTFKNHKVRAWNNGGTDVLLPNPDNDVFFVFTHFIKHFYKEGMNLRQVCDWCRLLWTFRDKIDIALLEKRLKKAGIISEWKAFASLAVDYLGMPVEAMPLFNENDNQNHKKAERLMEFILKGYTGSKMKDTYQIAKIFPWKACFYSPSIFLNVNWLKVKERVFAR